VTASRYNCWAPGPDDPRRSTAVSTRHVTLAHRNFGEFKVRGCATSRGPRRTAQRSLKTIRTSSATIQKSIRRLHTDGERILAPLKLDPRETADLIAFLESLSSPPAPFRRTQIEAATCDDDRALAAQPWTPAALTPMSDAGRTRRTPLAPA